MLLLVSPFVHCHAASLLNQLYLEEWLRLGEAGGGDSGAEEALAMAAGTAVLSWLKENRGWFYQGMRARLGSLEQELNAYCESRALPSIVSP